MCESDNRLKDWHEFAVENSQKGLWHPSRRAEYIDILSISLPTLGSVYWKIRVYLLTDSNSLCLGVLFSYLKICKRLFQIQFVVRVVGFQIQFVIWMIASSACSFTEMRNDSVMNKNE